jgi:hypothetical protein
MAKRHFMVRRKRDANHKVIQDALEAAGARVFDTSGVGGGCPDVFVLKPNRRDIVPIEIKTEDGTLKPSQKETHSEWPIVVVRNVDEALQAIGCRIGRRMRDEGREQGSR